MAGAGATLGRETAPGALGDGAGELAGEGCGCCAPTEAAVNNNTQDKNRQRLMTKSEKMKRSGRNANYIPLFDLEPRIGLETIAVPKKFTRLFFIQGKRE